MRPDLRPFSSERALLVRLKVLPVLGLRITSHRVITNAQAARRPTHGVQHRFSTNFCKFEPLHLGDVRLKRPTFRK